MQSKDEFEDIMEMPWPSDSTLTVTFTLPEIEDIVKSLILVLRHRRDELKNEPFIAGPTPRQVIEETIIRLKKSALDQNH